MCNTRSVGPSYGFVVCSLDIASGKYAVEKEAVKLKRYADGSVGKMRMLLRGDCLPVMTNSCIYWRYMERRDCMCGERETDRRQKEEHGRVEGEVESRRGRPGYDGGGLWILYLVEGTLEEWVDSCRTGVECERGLRKGELFFLIETEATVITVEAIDVMVDVIDMTLECFRGLKSGLANMALGNDYVKGQHEASLLKDGKIVDTETEDDSKRHRYAASKFACESDEDAPRAGGLKRHKKITEKMQKKYKKTSLACENWEADYRPPKRQKSLLDDFQCINGYKDIIIGRTATPTAGLQPPHHWDLTLVRQQPPGLVLQVLKVVTSLEVENKALRKEVEELRRDIKTLDGRLLAGSEPTEVRQASAALPALPVSTWDALKELDNQLKGSNAALAKKLQRYVVDDLTKSVQAMLGVVMTNTLALTITWTLIALPTLRTSLGHFVWLGHALHLDVLIPNCTNIWVRFWRVNAYREQMIRRLREKNEKKEASLKKQANAKVSLSWAISSYGGPWVLEDVEQNLKTLPPAKHRAALLVQIRFHKEVLHSKGDRILFQETSHGLTFSDERLLENLKEILMQNDMAVCDHIPTGLSYKNESDWSEGLSQKKRALAAKLEKARSLRQAQKSKKRLPDFLSAPESLVDCCVMHQCNEPGQEADWFKAKVLSVFKPSKNPLKFEFSVQYDVDDEIYYFPLLADLKKGDLIVLD
ncbi:hypothetical protein CAPTEDRAFT_210245 [Capitella teleta]|uniref:Uncharacterized protein n=1 Tax=Capitella teleta TaxID=283909 RepID=R7VBB1_CAPTE|nr:hypothetical protein CAPTEDRAFT_210245 [Capitella teleta]|eukprot:ELU15832.1 hypothetical protein CAPTEDRAFT_210245 [Capitella teleta]